MCSLTQRARALLHVSFAVLGLLSCVSSVSAAPYSGSGSGTVGDPFQIVSCSQLQEMQNIGSVGNGDNNAYYKVLGNIDCLGTTFIPVNSSAATTWQGNLDGNLKTISNLTINTSGINNVGLFAVLDQVSSVKNLILNHATVNGASVVDPVDVASRIGGQNVGILAGQGDGIISGVSTSGAVSGDINVGGLIGHLNGLSGFDTLNNPIVSVIVIKNCYASGDVSASAQFAGGLIGDMNFATLQNSFAMGHVSAAASAGGMVGINESPANNIFTNNFFDVTASGPNGCVPEGDLTGCIGINVSSSTPLYFVGNQSNPPLNTWDFANTWITASGQKPSLKALPTPAVAATATPTPVPTVTPTPTATPTKTAGPSVTATPQATSTPSFVELLSGAAFVNATGKRAADLYKGIGKSGVLSANSIGVDGVLSKLAGKISVTATSTKGGVIVVAKGAATVKVGIPPSLTLTLTKAGKKLLKSKKTVSVKMIAVFKAGKKTYSSKKYSVVLK